jgi:hypothetical protein
VFHYTILQGKGIPKVNDALTDGETEPGAFFFGGEERVEYFIDEEWRNARTGIVDVDQNLPFGRVHFLRNGQLAAVRHRFDAVLANVQKHLLEHLLIRNDAR